MYSCLVEGSGEQITPHQKFQSSILGKQMLEFCRLQELASTSGKSLQLQFSLLLL